MKRTGIEPEFGVARGLRTQSRGCARVRSLAIVALTAAIAAVLATRPSTLRGADERAAPAAARLADEALGVLKRKCAACHGDDPQGLKGRFDLRSRSALLRGGESGEAGVVPGRPDESLIYQAIRWDGLEMPPKQNDRLHDAEIALIRDWIAAGAPWPNDMPTRPPQTPEGSWEAAAKKDGVLVATSGGLSDDWTSRRYDPEALWAYRPVSAPGVPAGEAARGNAHPIDAFIGERLSRAGLTSALPADPSTLVRRLSFDLTGLPPTPEAIDAFMRDPSDAAYERLVERLLDSPHYGEQMARHWLDVVRYADTSGFSNDFERPHAWRYRDYVVRSFNRDKPYDRFVIEQLAGDELDENDADCLIATGFLRMGPWEHTAMTVAAVTRQQFLDDATHSVGVTFLGQGLRCAKCHDHKFDPVPTRDYYGIQSVFSPVQFVDRDLPLQQVESAALCQEAAAVAKRLQQQASGRHAELKRLGEQRKDDFLKQRGVTSVNDLPEAERRERFGLSEREQSLLKVYNSHRQYHDRAAARFDPYAFSVYSGPNNGYQSTAVTFPRPDASKREGEADPIHILIGGDLATPGDLAEPGVLSAVTSQCAPSAAVADVPEETHGRRLAFARWVASRDNPLTARVIVNRVWQMHFGIGLVATSNNFGKMGARPTHPELLDWLATWFMDHGWSIKQLHRMIVSSATYRQASEAAMPEVVAEKDPRNTLLSYFPPRRLSAEELRDAMLAASGELNLALGGPGVFPEINREIAMQLRFTMGAPAPAYQPSPRPEDRHRRSLYIFRLRTLANPLLEVFDQPGSDVSCEQRTQTTVTPQVFAMFNGQFSQDRAIALAARLQKQAPGRIEQVADAFRLAYGRTPTERESAACLDHIAAMIEHHRRTSPVRQPVSTSIEREMYEELTGGTFNYTEELEIMKMFQPDLKPWDVSAETRALAELCLVLLNSNEFVYVR